MGRCFPVQQIFGNRMPPVHRPPMCFFRIMLIKQMIGSVHIYHSVRIIDPHRRRGKMQQWSVISASFRTHKCCFSFPLSHFAQPPDPDSRFQPSVGRKRAAASISRRLVSIIKSLQPFNFPYTVVRSVYEALDVEAADSEEALPASFSAARSTAVW